MYTFFCIIIIIDGIQALANFLFFFFFSFRDSSTIISSYNYSISHHVLYNKFGCVVNTVCGCWSRRERARRERKREDTRDYLPVSFFFCSIRIVFFLLDFDVFSRRKDLWGRRNSGFSQIADGTATFSACRSAPRSLLPHLCTHRPLFLLISRQRKKKINEGKIHNYSDM